MIIIRVHVYDMVLCNSLFHMQLFTFQTDDSQPPTNRCVDLMLAAFGQKTTHIPRPCTCERCGTIHGRECCTGDSESRCSVANMRSSRNVVAVAGIPGKACEYGLDNHYATPSHESYNSNRAPPSTNSNYSTAPIVPNPVTSRLLVSSQPTMAKPNSGALAIVASIYKAVSLLNGKDKGYKNNYLITNGNSTAHMRDNSHYQQSGFQLWKCLKMVCECVCLFEKMLLLVLIVGARKVKSDMCFDNKCVDSGGSSSSSNQGSGGGSSSSGSGSGKKQQNTNSNRSGSSSSSSQRSGSGSSQRGGGSGTGMGGGRTLSGSSGDSSDDGDDDHNKRPRQQLNKEPKSKPDFDDEDDEETDSADEGGDDHSPSAMTLELNSPPSIQNDNGGPMSSHGGLGLGEGGEGKGQEGRRGRNNLSNLPLLGGGSSGTSSSRFSTSMSGGATVESITLKEGIAGGSRIATTTLISSSQINSPVNMAVGYGVPVLAATDGDGLMTTTAAVGATSSSSVPNSELGTPTQDSPSPPPHLGGRDTPGTPRAMSPEITPNPQVK